MKMPRLFGHPLHSALSVIPLGLLVAATVFDALYLARRDAVFPVVAYWNLAAGIAGGLVSAVFGVADWLAIAEGDAAKSVGVKHAVASAIAVAAFTASWVLREDAPSHAPGAAAIALSFAGTAAIAVAGWLGGELVLRHGVGASPVGRSNARGGGGSDGGA